MLIYYILVGILGYLLGNIQSAVILSKLIHKDDVRNYGSGNAGSTNMLRVYGIKSGLITFVGDCSKGILAVLIGRLIAGEMGAYICALFTVLGHDFPVFLKFRGGKGVASTLAIIWMLSPLYAAVVTAIALVILIITRTVAIASISCMTLYFLVIIIFEHQNISLLMLAFLLWALILLRHKDNIRRIIKGEESKVFSKEKVGRTLK
ncbi:glycerol-3-phosphate 1-O-acyltransferase PlsY [Christensenellaceae bacterium OttesenSCG-928-M15]|nr:glycerol-3-phosphate 1-O-acyltransferase PlsY [Christensenellaceae bacterium OttesenSCG-928-M15]